MARTMDSRVNREVHARLSGGVRGEFLCATQPFKRSTGTVSVSRGNGDGSFAAQTTFSSNPNDFEVVDTNHDMTADILVSTVGLRVFIGNSNGTFKASSWYATSTNPAQLKTRDLNGDGHLDVIATNYNSSLVSILMGNGDGSYKSSRNYESLYHAVTQSVLTVGDVNNDGSPDIAVTEPGGTYRTALLLGNSDGSFRAPGIAVINPGRVYSSEFADMNGDGILDFNTNLQSSQRIGVSLGNGDGTFKVTNLYSSNPTPTGIAVGDFTGDGIKDILTANSTAAHQSVSILRGNADGSLRAPISLSLEFVPTHVTVGDLNSDNIPDLLAGSAGNQVGVFLGNGSWGPSMPALSFSSASAARQSLDVLEDLSAVVASSLGQLGAVESRLVIAARRLFSDGLNRTQSASRITEVDVASETATMVSALIKEKLATQIIEASSRAPTIILDLLNT